MEQLGWVLLLVVIVWFTGDVITFGVLKVRAGHPYPGYFAAWRLYFRERWGR